MVFVDEFIDSIVGHSPYFAMFHVKQIQPIGMQCNLGFHGEIARLFATIRLQVKAMTKATTRTAIIYVGIILILAQI